MLLSNLILWTLFCVAYAKGPNDNDGDDNDDNGGRGKGGPDDEDGPTGTGTAALPSSSGNSSSGGFTGNLAGLTGDSSCNNVSHSFFLNEKLRKTYQLFVAYVRVSGREWVGCRV